MNEMLANKKATEKVFVFRRASKGQLINLNPDYELCFGGAFSLFGYRCAVRI
jgi:hypothetical protein